MENSRLDSDVPLVLPKGITGEAWLHTITNYTNTMRQKLPDVSHPSDEYLNEDTKLYSSGQNPSAVGGSSVQPDTSQDLKLEKIERTLD